MSTCKPKPVPAAVLLLLLCLCSWFLLLYVAYMAVFVLFGSVIGLNMFRKNSYGE